MPRPDRLDMAVIAVTVAFVLLRLTGVIYWSWLWVLAPLWVPVALMLVGWAIMTALNRLIR